MFKNWQDKNSKLGLPYVHGEPAFYFDMDAAETEEFTLPQDTDFGVCRYVKFVPTSFRKSPINFSSKHFDSNTVEVVFFGL